MTEYLIALAWCAPFFVVSGIAIHGVRRYPTGQATPDPDQRH